MKPAKASVSDSIPNHGMRICGRTIGLDRGGDRCIPVVNPYTGECIATVPKATLAEVRQAFAIAHAYKPRLSRFERSNILMTRTRFHPFKLDRAGG